MKIQIDTENKTIRVDNNIPLGELIKTLKKLLPNGEWKEYELIKKVETYPYYIPYYPYYPPSEITEPIITFDFDNDSTANSPIFDSTPTVYSVNLDENDDLFLGEGFRINFD
ncbi:MAG: hypothetical protein ACOCVF_02035 [bacterium]